jgi:hypothetical protein
MTTGGCGTVFAVANLLLFMGLMYWAWRYGINHYLCVAAVSGDLNTAETMLRLGASPNYRLPNGDTPFDFGSPCWSSFDCYQFA